MQALLFLGLPGLLASAVIAVTVDPTVGLVLGLLVLLALGLLLITLGRQWRAWGWQEREDDLLVRRGVLVRRLSAIPYGRMQYVDTTAGPLDRKLGLTTLVMHTAAAASDARLPGLPNEEATRLRDRLVERGEARTAGL